METVKESKVNKEFDRILRIAAKCTGIPCEIILSKTRKREIAEARQIVMFCIKLRYPEKSGVSLKFIGDYMGRDHATVIHACRVVNDLYETDQSKRKLVNRIIAIVNGEEPEPEDEEKQLIDTEIEPVQEIDYPGVEVRIMDFRPPHTKEIMIPGTIITVLPDELLKVVPLMMKDSYNKILANLKKDPNDCNMANDFKIIKARIKRIYYEQEIEILLNEITVIDHMLSKVNMTKTVKKYLND